MPKMTDDELLHALDYELQQSVLWTSDGTREEQQRNLQYYLGMPMGNEVAGRSQVVSWDVFESVESAMPNFIEPFFASDYMAEFTPRKPGDEAFAGQATDVVNFVIKDENPGFMLLNTWLKDGLISKLGVVRADWVEQPPKREKFKDLSTEQLIALSQEPNTEILEHEGRPAPGVEQLPPEQLQQMQAMGQPLPMLHDVTIQRYTPGQVEIENVRPENFVITRGISHASKARLIGEIVTYTRSELHEMGFRQAMEVQSFDDGALLERGELQTLRDGTDIGPLREDTSDTSQQEVRLFKGFIRADVNGDKVAEWRRVLIGGGPDGILENEECEYQNYCIWTPIPIPHRVIGMAYADAAAQIQDVNTVLQRQYLDSLYLANRPRTYVNTTAGVNLDDLLNERIGGIVRGTQPMQQAIGPLQTNVVSRDALEGLEMGLSMRERRLGLTRYNQGLDADSLNKTATGVTKIQQAGDKRQMMTLRIFAETGVRDLFRLVLRLICDYQDRPKVARLRGQFVEFDPRLWSPDMDVRVDVGVGTGDKTETAVALREYGQLMVALEQKGMVDRPQWYEFGLMMAKALGLKAADNKLVLDPAQLPPPEPPPDQMQAEMAKVQAQIQADQAKAQMQAQVQMQTAQANLELQAANDQRDAERERMKAELQAQIQARDLELRKYLGELEAQVKLLIAGINNNPPQVPTQQAPTYDT